MNDGRDILGERAVYPGHPAVIACLILHHYAGRIEAAFAPGRMYPDALERGDIIPGAGGNVYDGLDVIRRVLDGVPIGESLRRADDDWARCDGQAKGGYARARNDLIDRWRKGQEQADRIRSRLVDMLVELVEQRRAS